MAKVANRVGSRHHDLLRHEKLHDKLSRGRVLETKVSIASGFKELQDLNRQALISLKH